MGARAERREQRRRDVMDVLARTGAVDEPELAHQLSWGSDRALLTQTLRRLEHDGLIEEIAQDGPRRWGELP